MSATEKSWDRVYRECGLVGHDQYIPYSGTPATNSLLCAQLHQNCLVQIKVNI